MTLTSEQMDILHRNGWEIIYTGYDDKFDGRDDSLTRTFWTLIANKHLSRYCMTWEDCLAAIVEEKMKASG